MTNTFRNLIDEEIRRDVAYKEEHGYSQTKREESGHTIGDFVRATMKIEDEETSKAFYEGCVEFYMDLGNSETYAEEVARSNIGWCFGEGMKPELIALWSKICGAAHPVFGTMTPTSEEAFQAGKDLAENL